MMSNGSFPRIKNNLENTYKQKVKNLEALKENLLDAKSKGDTRLTDYYVKRISNDLSSIDILDSKIKCMRPNSENDLNERERILKSYAKKIDEAIPDDVPLVFHGNNNIELVTKIISSGGLYTPEERGVDSKSFASQIDVTSKSNIRVSLEFADSGANSFMPYGALFVFYPREYEYDKVLKTGKSSEVEAGVSSVNFSERRFIGVITTIENKEKLRTVFVENNLDPSKVFTHDEFLGYCKNKFKNDNNENNMRK